MKCMVPVVGVALFAATVVSSAPAAAASYPWCARYATSGGECAFNTREQCMETLSGIGGACTLNPGYTGPAASSGVPSGPYNYVPSRHHRAPR